MNCFLFGLGFDQKGAPVVAPFLVKTKIKIKKSKMQNTLQTYLHLYAPPAEVIDSDSDGELNHAQPLEEFTPADFAQYYHSFYFPVGANSSPPTLPQLIRPETSDSATQNLSRTNSFLCHKLRKVVPKNQ